MPTDFFGHGDKSSRSRCAELRDFAPICKEVKPDVVWMIRFPNAEYLCEQVAQDAPPEHFIFTPRVRIEVNLAWNRTITGFVFEAPFLSEELSQKLNSELLPILGLDPLGPDGKTRECDTARRQAFDDRVKDFIEMTKSDALDDNTKEIIAELMHLATSITFLSKGGG